MEHAHRTIRPDDRCECFHRYKDHAEEAAPCTFSGCACSGFRPTTNPDVIQFQQWLAGHAATGRPAPPEPVPQGVVIALTLAVVAVIGFVFFWVSLPRDALVWLTVIWLIFFAPLPK
jgi:hypothetical protein